MTLRMTMRKPDCVRACVRALSRTYEVLPEGAERDPRKIVAAIVNSVSPNKHIPRIDHTV